jgi:hypothetical protein
MNKPDLLEVTMDAMNWDFDDFALLHEWQSIFEIPERRVRVGESEGIEFYIYGDEFNGKHHTPHLHAKCKKEWIVINIINFQFIHGSLIGKSRKNAISWVKSNQSWLLDKFNKMNECRFTIPLL